MVATLTKLFGLIRDTITDSESIFDIVGNNIYPEEDIALANDEFPCIIFEHVPGKTNEPSQNSAMDKIKFYIYSEDSKKECYEIYDLLKSLFKTQSHHSDDNYHLNISGSGRPKVKTDYNPVSKNNLYYLEITFDAYVAAK